MRSYPLYKFKYSTRMAARSYFTADIARYNHIDVTKFYTNSFFSCTFHVSRQKETLVIAYQPLIDIDQHQSTETSGRKRH